MNLDTQIKAAALDAVREGIQSGAIKINFPASGVRTLIKEETPAIAAAAAKEATKAELAALTALINHIGSDQHKTAQALIALSSSVESTVKQLLAELPAASGKPVEIRSILPHKTVKMEGVFHQQFSEVLKRVQLNALSKRGLWLWGAAGGGKTTMAQQIAEALDVKFVPVYGSPTLTDTKLLGYNNASTGAFVPGSVYDAYACPEAQERGALLFVDEADAGEFLIVLNALLANDYFRFSNGEVLKRPKRFFFMAAANTIGNGSANGMRRAVQDKATKDRFTPYRLEYDEKLEAHIAAAPQVSKWVFAARKWIEGHVQGGVLTPRTHFTIADYWRAGIDTAAEEALSGDLSADNWKAMKAALPAFPTCPATV